MSYNLLRNDPAQTITSSQHANESVNNFRNQCTQFGAVTTAGTGLEGASQVALANAGQRVNESGTKFQSMADPRVQAIADSAHASMQVGDDAAHAIHAVEMF